MGLFGSHARVGASAAGAYEIAKSLRFDSGSDSHLEVTDTRTVNTGAYTFSLWFKRTNLDESQGLYIQNGSNTQLIHIAIYSNQVKWYNYSGSDSDAAVSDGVIRDSNAWYHLVCKKPSGSAGTMYINGVAQSSTSLATDIDAFSMERHIGNRDSGSGDRHFNGYIAEFHAIDGTAVAHTEFGETDADTGQWIAKKYVGSYGNKGFYLKFSDNSGTTATTLGKDYSGNGNNWTPTNFGTGDVVKDTPTNNFCKLLSLMPTAQTNFLQGDLYAECGATHKTVYGTLGVKTGKWYWEGRAMDGGTDKFTYGLSDVRNTQNTQVSGTNYLLAYDAATYAYGDAVSIYGDDLRKNGSVVTSGAIPDDVEDNDIVSMAFDADTGKVWFALNGTWANGSGTASTTLDPSNHDTTVTTGQIYTPAFSGETSNWFTNFGQDSSFANNVTAQGNTDSGGEGDFYYAVPSGFKALCVANLPEPTIPKSDEQFNTILYTGNATSRSIVSGFTTGFVWIKRRSGSGGSGTTSDSHVLANSTVGANSFLMSNSSAVQNTASNCVTAFNSDGVTVGTQGIVNDNSETFVSWHWKESATAGFDVVTYSGNGNTTHNISHNLGVVPDVFIVKSRTNAQDWYVMHTASGANKYLVLSGNGGQGTNTVLWGNTLPTSSVFTVGENGAGWATNESGEDYVAYVFASVEGYSKIGTYIGNGSTNGTFTYTGFKPAWLMIRRINDTGGWEIVDNKRDPYNEMDRYIYANTSYSEYYDENLRWDFLANGFKMRTSNVWGNADGSTYLYIAFAERPLKYANAR